MPVHRQQWPLLLGGPHSTPFSSFASPQGRAGFDPVSSDRYFSPFSDRYFSPQWRVPVSPFLFCLPLGGDCIFLLPFLFFRLMVFSSCLTGFSSGLLWASMAFVCPFQNHAVMHQTIHNRDGSQWILKDLIPFAECLIGTDHHSYPFILFGDGGLGIATKNLKRQGTG